MEVKVNSLVARQGVAVVELHVDTEQAGPWLLLVGKRVGLAIGAVMQESGRQPHGRAASAVKRSQKREQQELVTEAVEQEKRKQEKKGKKKKPSRKKVDQVRNKLRAQMPDGWLLVADFAAQVCRPVKTVRRWAKRGGKKIRAQDVRDVPVKNFKQPTVKAIRASLIPKLRSGQPGKGGSSSPIMALVDREGVGGAAKSTGLQVSMVRAAYEQARLKGLVARLGVDGAAEKLGMVQGDVQRANRQPDVLDGASGVYRDAVVIALASVMKLAEDRGEAREEGDERDDTSRSVPASDEKAPGPDKAAWRGRT